MVKTHSLPRGVHLLCRPCRYTQQMRLCLSYRAPAHNLSSHILLAKLLRVLLLRTAAAVAKLEMVHQSLLLAGASQ